MKLLLLLLAAGFFFTGLAYFYNPNLIVKINSRVKKLFFDDEKLIVHRKRTAAVYLLVAIVIFYVGVYLPSHISPQDTKNKIFATWKCYYCGNYGQAEKIASSVLAIDPNNPIALEQLGLIYFSKGEREKARFYLKKAIDKNPGNKRIMEMYNVLCHKGRK